jgi:hypothetical protein
MILFRLCLLSYYAARIVMQEIDLQLQSPPRTNNNNIQDQSTNDQPNVVSHLISTTANTSTNHSTTATATTHVPNTLDLGNCPLCLDRITQPATPPCGHICCWSCLTAYATKIVPPLTIGKCPVCRHDFTIQRIRALHFG